MTTIQGSGPPNGPSDSGAGASQSQQAPRATGQGDARWQAVEVRINALAAARPRLTITKAAEVWFSVAPGVQKRLLHVDADAGWESFFLKLAPGAELPSHRHTATEEGLVLSGEIEIDGELLREGDLHIAFAGHDHGLLRSETGALLYIRGPLAPLEDLDLSDPLLP
jgi:anti-sigma factor ChrR (cupin superfamily)